MHDKELQEILDKIKEYAPNTDTTEPYPYMTTNSFFTMNLNCVCALRCLQDTYVDCI